MNLHKIFLHHVCLSWREDLQSLVKHVKLLSLPERSHKKKNQFDYDLTAVPPKKRNDKTLCKLKIILDLNPNIKHVLSNVVNLLSIIIAIYLLQFITYKTFYYFARDLACCMKRQILTDRKFQFDRISTVKMLSSELKYV